MSKLNKKFYKILDGLRQKSISGNDVSHEDKVTLLECGFLRHDNYNIVSSEGILALDEYRSDRREKIKSCVILIASIISCVVGLITCFRK